MKPPREATAVVINDDPVQLRLTSALLRKEGLRVRACAGGEEALRQIRRGPAPDLIVTDISMPGIDGWRLCRLLRSPEYARFNHVPILVLSATFSGADARQVTRDLGADAFLPAPYDPATFRRHVRALLGGRRPRRRGRALILDGDPAMADALREAFAREGFDALAAADAEQARRLYRRHRPEVAVVSHPPPDGSCARLIEEFKRPGTHTAVVVAAAEPDERLALECTRRGADALLRKPCAPEEVVRVCLKAGRERAMLRIQEVLEERTEALRRSEERFRALFDSLPEIVLVRDRNGVLLHVNACAARRLECEPAALVGRRAEDLVAPEHAPRFSAPEGLDVPDGSRTFEATLVTRSGRRLAVEFTERLVEFGGSEAVLSVARDISDRRHLEQALAQSEARFHFLLENAFDGISVCEFDPVTGRRRLLLCNQRFAAMAGRPREELLAAEDLGALQSLQATPEEQEHYYRCLLRGTPVAGLASWNRPDGRENAFEWTAVSFRLGPRWLVLAVDRDITRRRRIEREVHEALARFEAVIEHTPFLAIQGFDRSGTIRHWNAASERLYGYPAAEAVGRRRQDLLLCETERADFEALLARVWATGEPAPTR